MTYKIGDKFVFSNANWDEWYGVLEIIDINDGYVFLESENNEYEGARDRMFPVDDFEFMLIVSDLIAVQNGNNRQNPAKCNDGSFSASPHNSKGTCTYHEGVQGSATQAQYDKSQSRVRYRSPKGYTGSFAPPKGKTSKKVKSAPQPTVGMTKKQIKDLVIDVVKPHKHSNMSIFAQQVASAGYASNIFDENYSLSSSTYSNVIDEIASSLLATQVHMGMDDDFIINWINGFGKKLSDIMSESLNVANDDYDFSAFKNVDYIEQTVVDNCIKYFAKKGNFVVCPNYLDIQNLSDFDYVDASKKGHSMHLRYDNVVGSQHFTIFVQLVEGVATGKFLYHISFKLGFKSKSYGLYQCKCMSENLNKAIDFITSILKVNNFIHMVHKVAKKDTVHYQFAKTLLVNAQTNGLAYLNVLSNLILDANDAIVKPKTKGVNYRLGNLLFQTKNKVSLQDKENEYVFPIRSDMESMYAMYLFNGQNIKVKNNKAFVGDLEFDTQVINYIKLVNFEPDYDGAGRLKLLKKLNSDIIDDFSKVGIIDNYDRGMHWSFVVYKTKYFKVVPVFMEDDEEHLYLVSSYPFKNLDEDQIKLKLLKYLMYKVNDFIKFKGYRVICKGMFVSKPTFIITQYKKAVDKAKELQSFVNSSYPNGLDFFDETVQNPQIPSFGWNKFATEFKAIADAE